MSKVKQGSNLNSYAKSCSELTLYSFIKVLVTNDLSYIGHASKETLAEAWETIFSEYVSLISDTTHAHLLSTLKKVAILENKLLLIQAIVDELAKGYNKDLCECLKLLGFKYKYTPESLENDLRLTITNAKGFIITLNQSKKDLESLQSKGEGMNESDFDNLLVELSKFMGYRINSKEIVVTEFVAIQNSYKASFPKNGQ